MIFDQKAPNPLSHLHFFVKTNFNFSIPIHGGSDKNIENKKYRHLNHRYLNKVDGSMQIKLEKYPLRVDQRAQNKASWLTRQES